MTATGNNRLPVLAATANEAHERVTGSLRSAAENARAAGEALLEAKRAVGHGRWSAWLRENFRGTPRTAQRYTRIAARWPELTKSDTVSDLTIGGALALLAEPRTLPEDELERLQAELAHFASIVDEAPKAELPAIVARCNEIAGRCDAICNEARQDLDRLLARTAA